MEEEAKIIKGCMRKDQQCRTLLYKKYAPSLYAVALRYTKTEEDAQDVLQEAFMRIYDNIKQFEWRGSFHGWLAKIVVNQAITYGKQRSKVRFENYEDYEELIADETMVESDQITLGILLDFIRELPQQQQILFNLCEMDGYSYKEAAKELNSTEISCRTQLSKAKKILRDRVSEFLTEETNIEHENIQ